MPTAAFADAEAAQADKARSFSSRSRLCSWRLASGSLPLPSQSNYTPQVFCLYPIKLQSILNRIFHSAIEMFEKKNPTCMHPMKLQSVLNKSFLFALLMFGKSIGLTQLLILQYYVLVDLFMEKGEDNL